MFKVPKQSYTAEFKVAAVQRVKDGQGFAVVARELGMSEQTLRNWVKAEASGKLNGAGEASYAGADGAFADARRDKEARPGLRTRWNSFGAAPKP